VVIPARRDRGGRQRTAAAARPVERAAAGRAGRAGPSRWPRLAASAPSRPSPAAGPGTGPGPDPEDAARARPRRQAVSAYSRSSSVSSSGSSPVAAAARLISASWGSGSARRVAGRRRGLATLRAGLPVSAIGPSSTARRYRQRSGHQVLLRAAAAPGVPAGHHVGLDVRHQLPDLRRRRLIETAGTTVLDDPVLVRAVRPPCPGADRRRHHRHVFGERRRRPARLRDRGQVSLAAHDPKTSHFPPAITAVSVPASHSRAQIWRGM
jgi:hypothetical protein